MIRIAPSLLAADFLRLGEAVDMVNRHADLFHLDIMDGRFVPNISFGFPVTEAIAARAEKPLDVHLMIVEPRKYAERFIRSGASMVSFHYEAALEETPVLIDEIQAAGARAGLVINPDCPVQKIFPYLDKVDYVLIMSVFAGFGGQKFLPESLERIREVRKELDRIGRKEVSVEADGGIGPANAAALIAAGADILVAGNAIFKAVDPAKAIQEMRGLI